MILMGRLTRDPEVRYTAGEEAKAIARYTLAVDRRFKREGEVTADFISCVAFGRQAEFAETKKTEETKTAAGTTDPDGFMNIPEGIDEDLPFS